MEDSLNGRLGQTVYVVQIHRQDHVTALTPPLSMAVRNVMDRQQKQ